MNSYEFKTWLSFLFLGIAIIFVFHIVSQFETITGALGNFFWAFAPFVWGFMIAYVLDIPRQAIENLISKTNNSFVNRRKRGLSIAATYIAFITILTIIGSVVFPRTYEAITEFIVFLPQLFETIAAFVQNILENDLLPFVDFDFDEWITNIINIDEIMSLILAFDFTYHLTEAFGTFMNFTSGLFRLALSIIASIYFLVEADKLRAFFKRTLRIIISDKIYQGALKYGNEMNVSFKRYIYCQVLDAVILGTLATLVLTVMGANYAFVLGPIMGFANLIPYFGAIFATILAVIVIFVTDGTTLGIVSIFVLVIMQQIDANFIFPKILGGSMKISPLLVIIGVALGNHYFGVIGIIMSTPVIAMMKNILVDIVNFQEKRRGFGRGV